MILSNSEVSTFQTCERKHYYAFREALKPRDGYPLSLTRGIVGHEVLETYYKWKQAGHNRADCERILHQRMDELTEVYPAFPRELQQLKSVLIRYVDFYWDEPWKILKVESLQETPLLENSIASYGMRLDLLVEVTAGTAKGQVIVVDHKFVYDFFSDKEKQMNTQLAKYIKTLRDNGIPVRKGVLNQIRYRKLKEPKPEMMFRRDPIVFTEKEIDAFWSQFKKPAQRIAELTALTQEEHFQASEMHIDKQTCGSCTFQPLCKLELLGLDQKPTRRLLYAHNDYVDNYRR